MTEKRDESSDRAERIDSDPQKNDNGHERGDFARELERLLPHPRLMMTDYYDQIARSRIKRQNRD